jgi:RsiW-degrading membrane proteinase PrsW (M82 family)
MQFKELEIKPQGSRFKRLVKTPHFRKTLIAVCAGAGIGFLLFYMTEEKSMETMAFNDVIKSILIGGFFGFFVTNSPCARGRC